MRVSPFPKSTKTSAYVGQWGRLRFEGGSITEILQVKQTKLPQTTQLLLVTKNLSVTTVYNNLQIKYKDT